MNATDIRSRSYETVFHCGAETFHGDGSTTRAAAISGFGFPLPKGMVGRYTVTVKADNTVEVHGHKQARSKHGRHYFGVELQQERSA